MDRLPELLGVADVGYTCKYKIYRDGSTAIVAADRPIFRPAYWEPNKPTSCGHDISSTQDIDAEDLERRHKDNIRRSRQRAVTAVRDYCLSNEFAYFVTLTLDQTRIDRYSVPDIVKAMRYWCDNQVRRKGLYYILVPERHKDGAIHFHGFFPAGVDVVDSGTIVPVGGGRPKRPRSKRERERMLSDGGHVVYNLPDWKYGYSTAIALYGSYQSAVSYVCKYVSKAVEKIGGRWYYSGGKLRKPDLQYGHVTRTELLEDGGVGFTIDSIGLELAYQFISLEGYKNVTKGLCESGSCTHE